MFKNISLILVATLLVACGKDVDKGKINIPNPVGPGVGADNGTPLPVPVPPNPSGNLTLDFANSAWDMTSAPQINQWQIPERMVLTFPNLINQFSFDSESVSEILVVVNGDVICQYSLNPSWTYSKSSCVTSLQTEVGDDITLEGVPNGETTRIILGFVKN